MSFDACFRTSGEGCADKFLFEDIGQKAMKIVISWSQKKLSLKLKCSLKLFIYISIKIFGR